jgi:hypothetical protein
MISPTQALSQQNITVNADPELDRKQRNNVTFFEFETTSFLSLSIISYVK